MEGATYTGLKVTDISPATERVLETHENGKYTISFCTGDNHGMAVIFLVVRHVSDNGEIARTLGYLPDQEEWLMSHVGRFLIHAVQEFQKDFGVLMTKIAKMCRPKSGERIAKGTTDLPYHLYQLQDITDQFPWICEVYFPWKHPENAVPNCLAILGDGLLMLKFEVLGDDQYRVAEVHNQGGFFLTADHNVVQDRVLTLHELLLFVEDSRKHNLERHKREYIPAYPPSSA